MSGSKPVKKEPVRIPSPSPSCVTTATTLLRPGRPPSPAPSCTTTILFGNRDRGQISIRPLSAIVDQDDQISTVSGAISTSNPFHQTLQQPMQFATDKDDSLDDWRCSLESVADRLKYILQHNDKYQDVTFHVEGTTSTEEFQAHKLILRIASPVFDRIFESLDGQNQTTRALFVPVTDIEPSTFKQLLKYIYTDKIDIEDVEEEDLLSLLQASKFYKITPLYMNCVRLLKKCMSDSIAVRVCETAASYDDHILLDVALDLIASKANEMFQSDDFLSLSQDCVRKLFTRDDLRIEEVRLFEAAVRWGKHQCSKQGIPATSVNLRKVMLTLIPEIRFPLMKAHEVSKSVLPTKLLTHEEQINIYVYLSLSTLDQEKTPIAFKRTPRLPPKCLELDSGSSSDYREGGSISPDFQRMSSTANADGMDLTTEGESETASIVSGHSENRKKSRKHGRSASNSSSSYKKRRKADNERNRRDSLDKSVSPTVFNELFGDDNEKCIKLENTTVSLNNFIQECSRNERRFEIESIRLINVKIDDFKNLNGRKVYFPRLKQFELKLNIDTEDSIKTMIAESSFSLEKYLFFGNKNFSWSYEKLWSMGIDVTVVINKVFVLRLSHLPSHASLNKFNGALPILRSLQEQPLKSLVYYDTHFYDRSFPLSLKRMVILGIIENQCTNMTSFLQKFKQLKELIVHSPFPWPKAGSKELTLSSEFASKDKIRKLSLGGFHICLEPSIRFYNIVILSLWNVTWEIYFEEKFHHTFPKLQQLHLLGPVKGSPKLLRNAIKIGSLTDIVCWNCEFRINDTPDGSDVRNFLINCSLSESDKNFILRRKPEKKSWEGSKMSFQDFRQYFYEKFEFEFLYEDLDTFMIPLKVSS